MDALRARLQNGKWNVFQIVELKGEYQMSIAKATGIDEKNHLEEIFHGQGYQNYKWIDPQKVIVSQWVRMKCTYGCGEYGNNACCPPNVPSVAECEQFFHEYALAAIFRFEKNVDKPEDRHKWSKKVNAKLSKLERDIFLAGYERVFLLFMDSCCLCNDCSGERALCNVPRQARPSPEALAVDVYSTVRQFGFPIEVRTDYHQAMNRYAFMMIR